MKDKFEINELVAYTSSYRGAGINIGYIHSLSASGNKYKLKESLNTSTPFTGWRSDEYMISLSNSSKVKIDSLKHMRHLLNKLPDVNEDSLNKLEQMFKSSDEDVVTLAKTYFK